MSMCIPRVQGKSVTKEELNELDPDPFVEVASPLAISAEFPCHEKKIQMAPCAFYRDKIKKDIPCFQLSYQATYGPLALELPFEA